MVNLANDMVSEKKYKTSEEIIEPFKFARKWENLHSSISRFNIEPQAWKWLTFTTKTGQPWNLNEIATLIFKIGLKVKSIVSSLSVLLKYFLKSEWR